MPCQCSLVGMLNLLFTLVISATLVFTLVISATIYLGDLCGDVVLGHLVPGEVPEDLVLGLEVGMVPAVRVAAVVAQPDVIAGISQDVAQTLRVRERERE